MLLNTKEFASLLGTDYTNASAVLKFLVGIGKVKIAKRERQSRGRPVLYYEVPTEIRFNVPEPEQKSK